MLVWNGTTYDLDPNMLGIGCLNVIYNRDKSKNKELGRAQLMWLYYMYHPLSTYKKYKPAEKSEAIVIATFPVEHQGWSYIPEEDKEFDLAREWYINHIRRRGNPHWDTVQAYTIAIYNNNEKIRNPSTSPYELKTADELTKVLPVSLKRAEQQAEDAETILEENTGDRSIKKGERLPEKSQR